MIFQQTNPSSLLGARQALVQKLANQFAQQQKNNKSVPMPAPAGGGAGGVGLPVGLGAARNSNLTQNITGTDGVAAAIAARLGAINPRALSGESSPFPGGGVFGGYNPGGRNIGSSLGGAPGMNVNAPVPGGVGQMQASAPGAPAPGMGGVGTPTEGPGGVAPSPTGHGISLPGLSAASQGLIPIGGGSFFDPTTGKVVGLSSGIIPTVGAQNVAFGHGSVLS